MSPTALDPTWLIRPFHASVLSRQCRVSPCPSACPTRGFLSLKHNAYPDTSLLIAEACLTHRVTGRAEDPMTEWDGHPLRSDSSRNSVDFSIVFWYFIGIIG